MRRLKLIHSVDARWVATVLILPATLWLTCIPAHAVFPGKNGRIAFILQPDVFTLPKNRPPCPGGLCPPRKDMLLPAS